MMRILMETVFVGILLFVGARAQMTEGACTYTDCGGYANGCSRHYGLEVCTSCADGQTGYLCDLTQSSCGTYSCGNGSCYDEPLTMGTFCVCQPGYSGSRCEIEDASKQCGVLIDETDMKFLPTCSLKTTLTSLSQCINYQLPYYVPMQDPQNTTWQCHAKVMQTTQCFYRTIRDCSLNLCSSIYELGGTQVYQNIAREFYNPYSNFSQNLYAILCSPPDANGTFQMPTEMFNIGEPVCGSNLIDNLLRILTNFANNYPTDPAQICPSLIDLRTSIYNEVNSSCDWTKIGSALNLTDLPGSPGYVRKLFETAQEYFQEWVVPGCGTACTATCQNGGSCFLDSYGASRCDCNNGYHGDSCEFSPEECEYTQCQQGGSCNRLSSFGLEYCSCPNGTAGLFCELAVGSCGGVECRNGGSCFSPSGIETCVCAPGYSGSRCENVDESKQCPAEPETGSDMIFLPTCTLKTTLTNLSECINEFLPFVDPADRQATQKCYTKVDRVKHCMYRTIEGCSNTQCESAYWYGGVQLYLDISESLYDSSSNFSRALFEVLCTLPENIPETYTPEYFIGEPVCKSDLIDRLLSILLKHSRSFPIGADPTVYCPVLDNLKHALYNESKASCDFSNIRDALTYLQDPESRPMYWERLLNMAQEFFLEWTIPPCRVPEVDPCAGYCLNNGYCSRIFDGPFCTCQQYYGGPRCEIIDPTNVCPVPGDGDAALLPLCTLRTTLNGTLHCFADLALAAGGRSDFNTCSNHIVSSFTCFAHLVGNCSRSTCPSIWLIEGASGVAQEIFATLFQHEVIAGVANYVCRPPPAGGYVQFLLPLIGNVSIPFCQQSFLPDLIGVLSYIESEVMGITEVSQLCGVAEAVRGRVSGLLDQCDFSHLGNYLPAEIATWLQTVISAGRSIISDFTLPGCDDVVVEDGPCPVVTASSSQCQLADSWMCNYYEFRRSISDWGIQFVDWLQGCANFQQRNWDDWASSMGLKRGSMYQYHMGSAYGTDGFVRMIRANVPCPSIPAGECMGRKFESALGCTICYNPGGTRNARDLLSLYAEEFRSYHVLLKIYNALREGCSRSTLSCGGEGSTTAPPTPTFSATVFTSPTYVPTSSPFFTFPEGSGSGNGQN